jgi:sporulation protein YlmC with PRC-barrel domain
MSPAGRLKLVSQLLDLAIIDKDERSCGIVDDIEFAGGAGKDMRVKALLVGPGAYQGRMPRWLFALIRAVAGDRMARVPFDQIAEIGDVVKLKCRAEELGLHEAENRVGARIPRAGAL